VNLLPRVLMVFDGVQMHYAVCVDGFFILAVVSSLFSVVS
jgi:hypothetical protein